MLVVVVLDQQTESAFPFRNLDSPVILKADQDFTLPDILPGFSAPMRRFFE